MKNAREKHKNGKKKDSRTHRRTRLGKIVWAGITGVALLGGIGAGIYYRIHDGHDRATRRMIDSEFKGLEKYLESVDKLGYDNLKPTAYVIFQTHGLEGHGFGEKTERESWKRAIEPQLSILRTLQYLYENKRIQVICAEGVYSDDFSDIENPFFIGENMMRGYSTVIELDSDDNLKTLLFEKENNSGVLFPLVYSGIYLVGFEDRARKTEKENMMNKHEEAIKDFEIMEEKLENLKVAGGSVEEVLQIKENLKAILKKNMEYSAFIDQSRRARSLDSIRCSRQHANELYRRGLIRNKDVAIVIGAGHKSDYNEFVRVDKDSEYNMILITPRGIKK